MDHLEQHIIQLAQEAKIAASKLAIQPTTEKNKIIKKMAELLWKERAYLMKENEKDVVDAQKQGYAKALVDRLLLNEKRIKGMVDSLKEMIKLQDPVGEVLETFKRPNGLKFKKVRVAIGVIGIIYESRPNVTSDCVGLCLKSGNAVILKGGKEAIHSNKAIFAVLRQAFKGSKIPQESIQFVATTDRAAVQMLLKLNQYISLIIPRGGEELIRFVTANSLIPVVKHDKGVCHTYVSENADMNMAHKIALNAKVQRPGVCNAMETLLVHRDVAPRFLPVMIHEFRNAGVEIRGCPMTRKIVKDVKAATEDDWYSEYLDLILAVKVVDSTQEAIDHINKYGSQHSDAIVTDNKKEAEHFLQGVDSACLYVNASTRFTDGYEFGFGAEIGISTDRLHARGPMALKELTTYKYLVYGKGQIRK